MGRAVPGQAARQVSADKVFLARQKRFFCGEAFLEAMQYGGGTVFCGETFFCQKTWMVLAIRRKRPGKKISHTVKRRIRPSQCAVQA